MFVLPALSLPVIMPWLDVAIAVRPVTVIADSVVPPAGMAPFPSMEAVQPERFAEQPDVAGSQIVILVANKTDVFVAVPGVAVRNHHRSHFHHWRADNDHWLRGHIHWCRSPHRSEERRVGKE